MKRRMMVILFCVSVLCVLPIKTSWAGEDLSNVFAASTLTKDKPEITIWLPPALASSFPAIGTKFFVVERSGEVLEGKLAKIFPNCCAGVDPTYFGGTVNLKPGSTKSWSGMDPVLAFMGKSPEPARIGSVIFQGTSEPDQFPTLRSEILKRMTPGIPFSGFYVYRVELPRSRKALLLAIMNPPDGIGACGDAFLWSGTPADLKLIVHEPGICALTNVTDLNGDGTPEFLVWASGARYELRKFDGRQFSTRIKTLAEWTED